MESAKLANGKKSGPVNTKSGRTPMKKTGCQGRTKTASVGRSKSTSEARVVLACCRGRARGISPSLLHGVLNVAEQRTEQSYPGSVGG